MREHNTKKLKLSAMMTALVVFSILFLSYASAVSSLDIPLPNSLGDSYGSFKSGSDIVLLQTCTNDTSFCDGCNLTSIRYNGNILTTSNLVMEKHTSLFNYTLGSAYTQNIGHYTATGFCYSGNSYAPFAYTFEVTPSGNTGVFGMYILLFLLAYAILIVGIFTKNIAISILGGFATSILGLFCLNNGIDIYRNFATQAISLITMVFGSFWAVLASLEYLKDW